MFLECDHANRVATMSLKLCNLCKSLFIQKRQPISLTHLLRYYKSQHNIQNIYPNSSVDPFRRPEFKHTYSNEIKEAFSGFIPVDKLDIKYTRSSGAGGQNVNKGHIKGGNPLHFNEYQKSSHEFGPEQGKINKEGYLIITSERTRKQFLNQADCMDKIRSLIYTHSVLPKQPTKEEEENKAERIAKAKASTLKAKRHHSLKKQRRQTGFDSL